MTLLVDPDVFKAYDVLQVKRTTEPAAHVAPGRDWLDFSTIRSEDEGRRAVELVKSGRWEGKQHQFRIVRQLPFAVKLGTSK